MLRDVGTRILLLRHGQTDWNHSRRFQGRADVPLNEAGVEQAKAARTRLEGFVFDAVYSSPLSRALHTARLVRPGEPVLIDPRLAEIDVGTWAGLTWDEVAAQAPEMLERDRPDDFRHSATGETVAEVTARVVAAVEEIAQRHEGGTVLVASHGLALTCALHGLLGLPNGTLGTLGNAHFAELGLTGERWRLLAHNVDS